MYRTRRTQVLSMVALAALAATAAACGDDADESDAANAGSTETAASGEVIEIPIGVVGAASGPLAGYGEALFTGAQLAVEEINAAGFEIDGQAYEFVIHEGDTTSDAAVATAETRRLIEENDVVAIFGPTVSTEAVPTLDISQPAGVIQFTAASAAQTVLSEEPDTVPYLVISNNQYGGENGLVVRMAQEAFDRGVRSVVLLAPDDPSGRTIAPIFGDAFEAAGGEVLAEEYPPPDTTDFQPYLSRFADLEPDGMVMGYTDAYNIPLMTQGRQAEFTDWYIAATAGSAEVALERSGNEPYEHYMFSSTIGGLEDPTPEVQEYIDALEATGGAEISSLSWSSSFVYPFVYALKEAMERAGTVDDADAILEALKAEPFSPPGPVASLDIDENGFSIATFQVCDLTGGSPNCELIDL